MEQRLQKVLSAYGVASRRAAEQMIIDGKITVNGQVAQLGDKASETDVIAVEGRVLTTQPSAVYVMLNKPRGYVTTLKDEEGRKNVAELVADCGARVYPVGRLDLNSEGLLLLTNDGAVANRLMHPSGNVGKTYCAWVNGFQEDSLERLQQPLELDGYTIRPAKIRAVWSREDGGALLEITIFEGRNRQVRRMCAAADLRVTRLKRVAEGKIQLDTLAVGHWRHLTATEVDYLKSI